MGFPWGLDFGNQNCVVAIARKGGIDVIDNAASSRKTPCMVGLGGKERRAGEAAAAKHASNIKNTCTELKRLIGRRWNDETLQADLKRAPFSATEGPDGGILINLMYEKEGGELQMHSFTPEQLVGMLLVDLKQTAESHNKSPSPDCVISVPCWFTDYQRRAMLEAATIAGLNVLRLLNETAATALCWGLPRTPELPDDGQPPRNALFFDMGHSSTQVCLARFNKSKMTIVATAFDRSLGGRDIDNALLDHFAKEWKTKTGLSMYDSPKVVMRMLSAIDKVKQQLSGYTTYTKLPINVECLQEDRDFSSFVDTDVLTECCAPLLERAVEPVKQVVADSKLTFDDIHEIEMVGSATRSPLILNTIKDFFGKEPKRTMNSEEAVSKGCALMGAMISPNFRVRDFQVLDCNPYPIALSWSGTSSGAEMEQDTVKQNEVFVQHNVLPSTKMLTFMRAQPFGINAAYVSEAALVKGATPEIATFSISGIPQTADGGPAKVKVKVKLDMNGILCVDSAQAVEEVEEEEPAEKKEEAKEDTPMPDAPAADDAPPAEPEGQPAGEAAEKKDEEKPAEPKKKKLKKTELAVSQAPKHCLGPATVETLKNLEFEMAVQDKQIRELQDRKNELESYIYTMRDRVGGGNLEAYFDEATKTSFLAQLEEMENWLYEDEAESANKSMFVGKLQQLKDVGGPAEERYREDELRPLAVEEVQKTVAEYTALAASQEKQYEHIGPEDRAKVQAEVDSVSGWLKSKLDEQQSKSKTQPMVVSSREIRAKKDALIAVARPIMMKPKPLPPKEEPKKEEAKPEGAAAEGGAGSPPPKSGSAEPSPNPPPEGDAEPGAPADAMDEALD
mmetsp:Transcript_62527/g.129902  ORF Transcript_62527/g.129902 Transcript_62527/m.129902 type:complete len:847 (+) Transcript_62527:111-2651(+)